MKAQQITPTLTQLTQYRFVNAYLVREEDGLTLVDTMMGKAAPGIIAAAAALSDARRPQARSSPRMAARRAPVPSTGGSRLQPWRRGTRRPTARPPKSCAHSTPSASQSATGRWCCRSRKHEFDGDEKRERR